MKLSNYARKLGVTYMTAFRYWKSGKLNAYQLPTGTIIVNDDLEVTQNNNVALYARVSSSENKDNLDKQLERIRQYATAKGYTIKREVKEIGSGINDSRKQFLSLLQDNSISKIVVEHQDRSTRFGFNYIKVLLELNGRSIEVINLCDTVKEDLIQDFVSVITSFCARIYGQRRSRRKTEKLIKELQNENT